MLEPRFFKPQLRKVVEDDDLPDYHITMSFDPQARELLEEDGVDTRRWASNDRIFTFDNVHYDVTRANLVGAGDYQPYPPGDQLLDHFGGIWF